jgi:hypothetical protein
MSLLKTYLDKVYNERMEGSMAPGATSKEFTTGKGTAGVTTTYKLELAGNIITGYIGNEQVNISIQDFSAKYPEIAKEVLEKLKADGSAHYTPNDTSAIDFVKNPQTKNTLQATPDK